MSFARESLPFVTPPLLLAVVLVALGQVAWAGGLALLALSVLLFFRVPRIKGRAESDLVLAAAFGRVTAVDRTRAPTLGDQEFQRIVTFLSVFDVHIQRCPVSGRVKERIHSSGRKVAAFRKDANEVNESELSVIEGPAGQTFAVQQIVGLIARRIVCYLEPGQRIERGESMGLIRFGSRVDLYVPHDYEVLVQPGDKLRAGETVVARPGGARAD